MVLADAFEVDDLNAVYKGRCLTDKRTCSATDEFIMAITSMKGIETFIFNVVALVNSLYILLSIEAVNKRHHFLGKVY